MEPLDDGFPALDELFAFDDLELLGPSPLLAPVTTAVSSPDGFPVVDDLQLTACDGTTGGCALGGPVGEGDETRPSPPSAFSSPRSISPRMSPAATYVPPPPTTMRRRRRQKQELDYLRIQVRALEDELQRLRSVVVTAGVRRSCSWRHDETDSARAYSVPIKQRSQTRSGEWEELARKEIVAVRRALMENIRLRAVLESQLSIARAFEKALQQQQLTAEEAAPYLRGNPSSAYVDHKTEEQIYESLGGSFGDLHSQVDEMLMSWDPGSCKSTGEVTTCANIKADSRGMYLEYREHRVLPYPVNTVCQIMWDALHGGKLELESGICITLGHTEDTVSLKIVDSFRLSKTSPKETIMTMRVVIKRSVEATRIVFAGESLVETVGQVCLRQREHVRTVFRSLEDRCEGMACVRVRPEMVMNDVGDGTDVGLLTKLVVSSYERNFGSMAKIVFNQLMTDQDVGC